MRAYERKQELDLLPVKCDGIKADAVVIADDEQLIQTARIMLGRSVPSIGSVINTFSNVYAVRGQFSKDSKEYEVLTKRLLCGQAISQATIDAKKAGKYFEIPKHWENAKHIEFLPVEEQEFNAQLVADKQPYFFMYNYDKTKSKYNEWKEAVNVRCIAHWHTTYDKLVNTPEQQLTEEQRVFMAFAKEQCPVNAYDNSTMYTFSKVVEEELEEVRLSTNKTDCRHLLKIAGVTYTDELYKQARREYYIYKNNRIDVNSKVYAEGCYDEEDVEKERRAIKVARDLERENFKQKFMELCNNDEKLAVNLLIDISYNDNTDVPVVWEILGDVIVTNLLEKHDYKVNAVVADKNGEVSYKGKQYKAVKLDIGVTE